MVHPTSERSLEQALADTVEEHTHGLNVTNVTAKPRGEGDWEWTIHAEPEDRFREE